MSERHEDAEDRMKLNGPPEDWWKREEMSERPEEAISAIKFIYQTRHLPITGMDLPEACGAALDYITQLETENAKYKADSERLDAMDGWNQNQWEHFFYGTGVVRERIDRATKGEQEDSPFDGLDR